MYDTFERDYQRASPKMDILTNYFLTAQLETPLHSHSWIPKQGNDYTKATHYFLFSLSKYITATLFNTHNGTIYPHKNTMKPTALVLSIVHSLAVFA